MAVVHGYCTTDQIREHLGDTGTKIDIDLLERAVTSASRAVDSFTGRRFWQDSAVKVRYFRPESPLIAMVDDISTTTGLIIATDSGADYSWSDVWASTDYDLEPDNADQDESSYAWWRVRAVGNFAFTRWNNRRTVKITAKFGWSAIPADVEYASILKSTSLFRRKDAPFGVAGFGDFGPVRISRKDSDVVDLLNPFVKVGWGST